MLTNELVCTDPDGAPWSSSEVARQCNVSEHLVRIVLTELRPSRSSDSQQPRAYTQKRGAKTIKTVMKTSKIGKRNRPGGIAKQCNVSAHIVAELRASLTADSRSEDSPPTRAYTTKHGSRAVMKTSKIGKRRRPVRIAKGAAKRHRIACVAFCAESGPVGAILRQDATRANEGVQVRSCKTGHRTKLCLSPGLFHGAYAGAAARENLCFFRDCARNKWPLRGRWVGM